MDWTVLQILWNKKVLCNEIANFERNGIVFLYNCDSFGHLVHTNY